MVSMAGFTSRTLNCKGCDNQCPVICYHFENGKRYYSGNRCERVFTNGEKNMKRGENMYQIKNELLFSRKSTADNPTLTVGIPRCLNMYEEYPFWHTLLESCNIKVVLSDVSNYTRYECNARMVMSDNICFPAKLVHSHIQNLIDKKVDRIFMPFVIFERQGKEQNSYNCPIVTGYSEVIKSVQGSGAVIDSPAINFKDKKLLFKQCEEYLKSLGVDSRTVKTAFEKACQEQDRFINELITRNETILNKACEENRMTLLLAGRPYHTDMLIQHKVSDMLADMGISIITDDLVRNKGTDLDDVHFLPQWSYPNRILRAAKWACAQDSKIQFVELTSFGCGPDAFLVDEVRDLLIRNGKVFTLLKLDDVNNVGSMKLRVRSLIESIRLAEENKHTGHVHHDFKTVPVYDDEYRNRKILVPFFTPFISPLIPAVMKVAGYDVENLPLSDSQSCEWGLKYANNEICYPATLVVGDIIKAFKSGKYDPDNSVIAMTQTGGQCRASNYIAIIKKALVDAGYENTPVVSLTMSDSIKNDQPAFRINWLKVLPVAFRAVLYSDCISKFYYASVVRERNKGEAEKLKDMYLNAANELIRKNRSKELLNYLSLAAADFNRICMEKDCPKVGIVGEIYLKFNTFAHRNLLSWLSERGIEVVPPVLTDFFMQSFVNRKVNVESNICGKDYPDFVYRWIYKIIRREIDKFNDAAWKFRYFTCFEDIFEQAEEARKAISLNAQFGEGWLLPGEMLSLARKEVKNVISLQLAVMLAAQHKGLPLTEELYARLTSETPWKGHVERLYGRWASKQEAYAWARQTLQPQCHPNILFSLGLRSDWQGNPWTLYDYAVASRGFAFWLDDADPQERGMIEEICRNGRFEPGAIVMGYAKSGDDLLYVTNRYHIGYVVSDYYANASFWCSYPNRSFRQRPGRAVRAEKGKIYVSVVFSDGDNVQFDQNALYAIWTDDRDRGEFPVGTTLCAGLQELNPFLMEWYYRHMSDNDELLAGPSGYQFIYGRDYSEQGYGQWLEKNRAWLESAGFRTGCFWHCSYGTDRFYRYVETAGLEGIFNGDDDVVLDCHEGVVIMNQGDHLVAEGDLYNNLAARQAKLDPSRPHFLNVYPTAATYGYHGIARLKREAERLERDFPGRFVFLLPKDNVATARAYYEQHPEHIPWKNRETKN